jgi:hypothetical protein
MLFRDESAMGVLRMKEHGTLPANAEIAAFLSVLRELFPEDGDTEQALAEADGAPLGFPIAEERFLRGF